jgi:hypothetical protein
MKTAFSGIRPTIGVECRHAVTPERGRARASDTATMAELRKKVGLL